MADDAKKIEASLGSALKKALTPTEKSLLGIEKGIVKLSSQSAVSSEEALENAKAAKKTAKEQEAHSTLLGAMVAGIKDLNKSFKDSLKQKTSAGFGLLLAGITAPIVTIVSFFKQLSMEFKFLKNLTGGRLKKIFQPLKNFLNSEKGIGKFFGDLAKKMNPKNWKWVQHLNPKNWKWIQALEAFFIESKTFQKFSKMFQGIKDSLVRFGKFITPILKRIADFFKTIFNLGKGLVESGNMAKSVLKFASKFGTVLGKIFLPITILMGAFDLISGFMEGYKEEGILGGLEKGLSELFKGLLGMPLDLLKKGVSWILEKFGWTEASKWLDSFSFSKLIEDTIGGYFDMVKKVVDWFGKLFTDPISTLQTLWNDTLKGAASIGAWIGKTVLTPITKFFVDTFTWTGDTLDNFSVMDKAQEMWEKVKTWFGKIFTFDWPKIEMPDMGEMLKGFAPKKDSLAWKILPGALYEMVYGGKPKPPTKPTKPTTAQTGADIVQSDEVAHQKYQEAQAKSGHGAATGGAKTAIASGDKDTMKAEIDAIYNSVGQNSEFTAEQKSNLNSLNVALGRAPAVSKVSGRESEKADNNLTGGDKAKLKDALGKRESGGKYNTLNSLGFSGKYQFGHMALEDMGLLKSGASKLGTVAKVTSDSSNWTIKGGLSTWLSNGGLQEKSMDKLMSQNLRVLKGAPGFKDFDKANVAGALAAAHLVGAGGAKKFLAGTDSKDAYGTKASDYFELGRNAIAAAKGFSGVVKQPTVFLTGEAGPEMVNVTPLHDPNQKTQAMNSLHNKNASNKMGNNVAPTIISPTVNNNSGGGETYLPLPATVKHDKFDNAFG